MSNNVGLDDWRAAIARSKELNKKIAEAAKANTTEEAPAVTEPVMDEVSTDVVADNSVEVVAEKPMEEPAVDNVVVEEAVAENVTEQTVEEAPAVYVKQPNVAIEDEKLMKGLENAARNTATKKSKCEFDFQNIRVDGPTKKYKGIMNKGLHNFRNEVLANGNIPDQVTLECSAIYTKNCLGVWEEGGSYRNRGSVLLVTDMYGKAKEAVTAYHNPNTCNGRHSLIPVDINDHVVLGIQENNKKLIGVYRISHESAIINEKSGSIICDKVATITAKDEDHDDIILIKDLNECEQTWLCEDKDDSGNVSEMLDDVLDVATKTLFETDISHPLYIKQYAPYNANRIKKDYWDVCRDKTYTDGMVRFSTLDEAYASLDGVFDNIFANMNLSGKAPLVVVCSTVGTDNESVNVHISVLLYDTNTKSSVGNRIYYCGVHFSPKTPGSKFYYPDTPEKRVSYETVAAYIKEHLIRPDGKFDPSLIALERMK